MAKKVRDPATGEVGKDGLPIVEFVDVAHVRLWLIQNATDNPGFWMKMGKKANPNPYVTYAEMLDECLCVGWIDGQIGRYDEFFSLQRWVPRRPRSVWSKNNVEHVERLTAEGRMQPAGIAAVDAAKADGRWEKAYHPASTAEIPPELAQAFANDPLAQAVFDALDSANRYAVIFRIHNAKRQETRDRNAAKFVEMLHKGETPHPPGKQAAARIAHVLDEHSRSSS